MSLPQHNQAIVVAAMCVLSVDTLPDQPERRSGSASAVALLISQMMVAPGEIVVRKPTFNSIRRFPNRCRPGRSLRVRR